MPRRGVFKGFPLERVFSPRPTVPNRQKCFPAKAPPRLSAQALGNQKGPFKAFLKAEWARNSGAHWGSGEAPCDIGHLQNSINEFPATGPPFIAMLAASPTTTSPVRPGSWSAVFPSSASANKAATQIAPNASFDTWENKVFFHGPSLRNGCTRHFGTRPNVPFPQLANHFHAHHGAAGFFPRGHKPQSRCRPVSCAYRPGGRADRPVEWADQAIFRHTGPPPSSAALPAIPCRAIGSDTAP